MKGSNFSIGIVTPHGLEGYGISVRINKEIHTFTKLGYPVTVFSLVQEGTIYDSKVYCISGFLSKVIQTFGFDRIANSRYLVELIFASRRIKGLAKRLGENVSAIAEKEGVNILLADDFLGSLIALEARRNMQKDTIVLGEFADLIHLDYSERFDLAEEDPLVINLREMLIEAFEGLDYILFVSPIDAEIAIKQLCIPSTKIHVLYEAGDIKSPVKRTYELNSCVCYLGSVSKWENLELFLKSYPYAKSGSDELIYKVVGGGPLLNRMKKLAQKADGKIAFYGWKPYNEAIKICLDADLGIVPTIKKRAMPSKLFVYSSLGLPVVSMEGMWWSNKIVKHFDIGYVIPPNQIDIGQGIREAIENPEEIRMKGIRARKMIDDYFNWEIRTKKILSILRNET